MNPTPEKFQMPDGLNPATVESLERIRLMARQRIIDARARRQIKPVQTEKTWMDRTNPNND